MVHNQKGPGNGKGIIDSLIPTDNGGQVPVPAEKQVVVHKYPPQELSLHVDVNLNDIATILQEGANQRMEQIKQLCGDAAGEGRSIESIRITIEDL